MDMTKRIDTHHPSVAEELAQAGACGQIHLATGRICVLPTQHNGSCRFLAPADIAKADKIPVDPAWPTADAEVCAG
jgi:hypothetical protein